MAPSAPDGTNDFNNKIIEEFRANQGCVGGAGAGTPMILLHHIGAKSGSSLASRIADVAGPGEVLASRAVVQQAGDGDAPYWFEQIEDADLKGAPDSVALFRVTRSRSTIGP
jgi:class 3 adenylate cyclase